MTGPAQSAVLASVQPARIAAIHFEEGQTIKAGDLVVQLEESIQFSRAEFARAAAESDLNIELARTRLQQAQRDLDRLVRLHGSEHSSSKELSDASATAEAARLEYELAVFNQAQAVRAYEREWRLLEEYRIRAPFDGYVTERIKHPGETVDQLEGVLRLAQLDPLLVTVDCPLSLAGRVKAGAEFCVRPENADWPVRIGEVIFASRLADGASQTFRVKLSVDNKDGHWVSGLKVLVDFSSTVAGSARPCPASPGAFAPLNPASSVVPATGKVDFKRALPTGVE